MATTTLPLTRPDTGPLTGRPTSYRDEYPDMLVEYFTSRPLTLRVLKTHETENLKDNARTICSEVPTFQGFAESIGVTHQILLDWARKWPLFRQAHARAKQIQEKFFTDGLSSGVMNPTGAIFVAKNILGWRDKIDIDTTTTSVDAGSNMMAICLQHSPPEVIARFRLVLDEMKAYAIAAGALQVNGAMPQIAAPIEP